MNIQDVHHKYNHIVLEDLDPIQKRGSKCIDTIAVMPSLMENVEGYKLLEINEVIATDHRAFIIDFLLDAIIRREYITICKPDRRYLISY